MLYKEKDLKFINYLISSLEEDFKYELFNLFESSKIRCEEWLKLITTDNPYALEKLLIEYMENQIRFIIHKSYNVNLDFSEEDINILSKYGIYHKEIHMYEQFSREELDEFFKTIK